MEGGYFTCFVSIDVERAIELGLVPSRRGCGGRMLPVPSCRITVSGREPGLIVPVVHSRWQDDDEEYVRGEGIKW